MPPRANYLCIFSIDLRPTSLTCFCNTLFNERNQNCAWDHKRGTAEQHQTDMLMQIPMLRTMVIPMLSLSGRMPPGWRWLFAAPGSNHPRYAGLWDPKALEISVWRLRLSAGAGFPGRYNPTARSRIMTVRDGSREVAIDMFDVRIPALFNFLSQ